MVKINRDQVVNDLHLDPSSNTVRKKTATKIVRSYKQNHCCEFCGATSNLTFHHVPSYIKWFNLGDIPTKKIKLNSLLIEMRKCQLLCESCHRRLHLVENNKILDKDYFNQILSNVKSNL